jgi:hypothetical protein
MWNDLLQEASTAWKGWRSTREQIRIGHPQTEIIEEMRKGEFDLAARRPVIPDGRVSMPKLSGVMKNAEIAR